MNYETITVKDQDGNKSLVTIERYMAWSLEHGDALDFTGLTGGSSSGFTVWWPWSRRWKLYARHVWRWLWWPYHFVGRAFHVVNDWLDPYDD